MEEKTLAEKRCGSQGHKYAFLYADVKEAIKKYQETLIYNASEKRKIIEVGKALHILKEIFGEELTKHAK